MSRKRRGSPPIKGNPRRQARAAIRGFVYQFWRTVQAWIELEPEENLYVEAAEDFDLVSPSKAIAAQVKDDRASGRLTLGSTNAITAVGNFWQTRKQNIGRRLQYKFVTTAVVGVEKDGFHSAKGIEIWNLCRISPIAGCAIQIESIRSFLLSKRIDNDLRIFLDTSSVEEVHSHLIQPFEWVANVPCFETFCLR